MMGSKGDNNNTDKLKWEMGGSSADDSSAKLSNGRSGYNYKTFQNQGDKSSSTDFSIHDDQPGCCCYKCFPKGTSIELKELLKITWPIVLTQIGQMIMGPISLMFCGHLGDPILLDGAALSMSMINATCIAIGQGLGTACDTFFSTTFGSDNKKKVGVYVQKAMLIFMLGVIPCIALHLNMEAFLRAVGQEERVAHLTGRYMLIFIPGSVSFFMYIVLAKYIQNQNIVYPNVVIGILANGANALLHYLFLYRWGWGTDGSAVAQAVGYFLMFILTLIYILVSKVYKDTWEGWSTECLQDWAKFLKLCIPGMLMLCMEWWGFEIGVFLTGLLGTTDLGAQAVVLQLDSIWFQVPLGIQIACAIRVGQNLGAGRPLAAKVTGNLSLLIVACISVVAMVTFIAAGEQLPYLFTNVESVAKLTTQLLPIVAIYVFFDGVATACKGVLYGTGRQVYGATLLFISYYVLALPCGIPLMFLTKLRAAGYWIALAGNLILQATVLVIIVCRTNWDEMMAKAQHRAGLLGESVDFSDEEEEEETPLVARKTSVASMGGGGGRRKRLISVSLSIREINIVLDQSQEATPKSLIFKRLLAALAMLCLLVAGILIRIFVPLEPVQWTKYWECLPDDGSVTIPSFHLNSTLPACNGTDPGGSPEFLF